MKYFTSVISLSIVVFLTTLSFISRDVVSQQDLGYLVGRLYLEFKDDKLPDKCENLLKLISLDAGISLSDRDQYNADKHGSLAFLNLRDGLGNSLHRGHKILEFLDECSKLNRTSHDDLKQIGSSSSTIYNKLITPNTNGHDPGVESLKLKICEVEKQLDLANKKQSTMISMENEYIATKASEKQLIKERDELREENKRLMDEVNAVKNSVKDHDDIIKAKTELENTNRQLLIESEKVSLMTKENRNKISQLHDEIQQSRQDEMDLQRQVDKHRAEVDKYSHKLDDMENQLEVSERELHDAKLKLDKARLNLHRVRKSRDDINLEIKSATARLESMKGPVKSLEKELADLQPQLADATEEDERLDYQSLRAAALLNEGDKIVADLASRSRG